MDKEAVEDLLKTVYNQSRKSLEYLRITIEYRRKRKGKIRNIKKMLDELPLDKKTLGTCNYSMQIQNVKSYMRSKDSCFVTK